MYNNAIQHNIKLNCSNRSKLLRLKLARIRCGKIHPHQNYTLDAHHDLIHNKMHKYCFHRLKWIFQMISEHISTFDELQTWFIHSKATVTSLNLSRNKYTAIQIPICLYSDTHLFHLPTFYKLLTKKRIQSLTFRKKEWSERHLEPWTLYK